MYVNYEVNYVSSFLFSGLALKFWAFQPMVIAMKHKSNLKFNPFSDNFSILKADGQIYTQDHTHIGTKLRNR